METLVNILIVSSVALLVFAFIMWIDSLCRELDATPPSEYEQPLYGLYGYDSQFLPFRYVLGFVNKLADPSDIINRK